ncbi:MAG: N-acetylglucosamine kinase [Hyphomicrobiales bacterium]|nr:N-acetylglucosamine kinase [Hyphomicrobiales bacterium]
MAQDYFLGIDGGGSSCRARIRTADGRLCAETQGGPANIHQNFEGALTTLAAVANEAAARAHVAVGALHAGLGLAGVTTAAVAQRVMQSGLPFARTLVDSDGLIACLGAHGGSDGGVVICGTGSAAFALLDGTRLGLGGHGFLLGDHGSGAVMGRKALGEALLAFDGLRRSTPLTRAILAKFGNEPARCIAWSRTAPSRDYAAWVPEILAHARQGERLALRLVHEALADLTALAQGLRRRGVARISLIGGLAAELQAFAAPAFLDHFVAPLADPLEGALMLARRAGPWP